MNSSSLIQDADDSTFAQLVLGEKDRAVLVDFWAEWCPPCLTLGKTIEGMAPEFVRRVKLVKVDVEVAPETTVNFGSRSLPYLVIFRDGKPVDQLIGNPGPARLRAFLTKHSGI